MRYYLFTRRIIATILLFCITITTNGQITSFLKIFKSDTLPTCVNYSYDEQVYFGAIYHTDTITYHDNDTATFEIEDIYEKNDNYQRDESKLLQKEFVKKYLLPDTKFIYTFDDHKGDTLFSDPIENYLTSDFYAINLVLATRKYYGVIYERIFSSGSIPSSEKYFCTFSKNRKFISRVLVASFVFSGTGYSNSGASVPWFSDEHGCINKDLTIKFTSQVNGEKHFKIYTNGTIIKQHK